MRSKTSTCFEVTVRYQKTDEAGKERSCTETYAVDAMSFTEAEAKITEHIAQFVSGEFMVSRITRANYKEVVFKEPDVAEHFYRTRIALITLDERSGKEKATSINYLINADTAEDAQKMIKKMMAEGSLDYKVMSLTETTIIDVFE